MINKFSVMLFASLLSTSALASDHSKLFKGEDLVKYRQSTYQVMSAQARIIGAMSKGDIKFDAKELHQRSINLSNAANLLPETYKPKTMAVHSSNVSPNAWADTKGMTEKGHVFAANLKALIDATESGEISLKESRPLVAKVMKSCKSCHDAYRKD